MKPTLLRISSLGVAGALALSAFLVTAPAAAEEPLADETIAVTETTSDPALEVAAPPAPADEPAPAPEPEPAPQPEPQPEPEAPAPDPAPAPELNQSDASGGTDPGVVSAPIVADPPLKPVPNLLVEDPVFGPANLAGSATGSCYPSDPNAVPFTRDKFRIVGGFQNVPTPENPSPAPGSALATVYLDDSESVVLGSVIVEDLAVGEGFTFEFSATQTVAGSFWQSLDLPAVPEADAYYVKFTTLEGEPLGPIGNEVYVFDGEGHCSSYGKLTYVPPAPTASVTPGDQPGTGSVGITNPQPTGANEFTDPVTVPVIVGGTQVGSVTVEPGQTGSVPITGACGPDGQLPVEVPFNGSNLLEGQTFDLNCDAEEPDEGSSLTATFSPETYTTGNVALGVRVDNVIPAGSDGSTRSYTVLVDSTVYTGPIEVGPGLFSQITVNLDPPTNDTGYTVVVLDDEGNEIGRQTGVGVNYADPNAPSVLEVTTPGESYDTNVVLFPVTVTNVVPQGSQGSTESFNILVNGEKAVPTTSVAPNGSVDYTLTLPVPLGPEGNTVRVEYADGTLIKEYTGIGLGYDIVEPTPYASIEHGYLQNGDHVIGLNLYNLADSGGSVVESVTFFADFLDDDVLLQTMYWTVPGGERAFIGPIVNFFGTSGDRCEGKKTVTVRTADGVLATVDFTLECDDGTDPGNGTGGGGDNSGGDGDGNDGTGNSDGNSTGGGSTTTGSGNTNNVDDSGDNGTDRGKLAHTGGTTYDPAQMIFIGALGSGLVIMAGLAFLFILLRRRREEKEAPAPSA